MTIGQNFRVTYSNPPLLGQFREGVIGEEAGLEIISKIKISKITESGLM